MAFEIKRNDRRPHYRVQLLANGSPVDLTAASGVVFTMKTGNSLKVTKASMTFIDRSAGIVEYAWGATDTDASGDFNVEIEVNWGGGETQTFPSKGYLTVSISDDLA